MVRRTLLSVFVLAALAMGGALHVTGSTAEPRPPATIDADRPPHERAVASLQRDDRAERSPTRTGSILLVSLLAASALGAGRLLRSTRDGSVRSDRVARSAALGQRAPPLFYASIA